MPTSVTPTRNYKLLSDLPRSGPGGVPIGRCTQMLPNRMQCWRPANYLVTETTSVLVEGASAEHTSQYQLCRTHAILQNNADKVAAQQAAQAVEAAAENAVPAVADLPDRTTTGTPQEQALQKEMVEAQTTMVQGEDSPNNK